MKDVLRMYLHIKETCTCHVVVAVDDHSMLRYIRDKTAAPYFSNLVWFIGGHVLELNDCVQHDTE